MKRNSKNNKRNSKFERRLLPYNKQLLIPEKSESKIPMTLSPFVSKPSLVTKFDIGITDDGYLIKNPSKNLAIANRAYSGKTVNSRLLRLTPQTFKFRMLIDANFRKLIFSNRYVYVQGFLILAPVAYEIMDRCLSVPNLLGHPVMRQILRDAMMQEVKKQKSPISNKVCVVGESSSNTSRNVASVPIEVIVDASHSMYPTNNTSTVLKYNAVSAPYEATFNKKTAEKFNALFNKFGGPSKKGAPPQNFVEYFKEITSGYDTHELGAMTGISYRTIDRIIYEKENRPQLRHLVAICIAVNAMPTETLQLVELAGLHFRDTLEEQAYLTLVNTSYMFGVAYCNQLLDQLGISTLSKKGLKK